MQVADVSDGNAQHAYGYSRCGALRLALGSDAPQLAGYSRIILNDRHSTVPRQSRVVGKERPGVSGYVYHRHYYRSRPYYGYYQTYPYYGGGYEPWNRPSPSDHIANQLNAQQARRDWGYWGYRAFLKWGASRGSGSLLSSYRHCRPRPRLPATH